MGGEIFKDSLRKLEVKPTQKYQKLISLETRENSQHIDMNIIKNNTNLIMKIMSQRNSKNKINKKEYRNILFLSKITLEKNLLALIIKKHINNSNYRYNDDNDNKKITPKSNRNIINETEDLNTIHKPKVMHTNDTKPILKDKEIKNDLKYITKLPKYSGNLTNKYSKSENKLKINKKTLGLNIFTYILAIYIKIKSFNMFDPGINIKDPGDKASTINFKIILDNFNLYNSKFNFRTNIMNNIIYERKIKIFIDDVNYPILIEICKLLAEVDNAELATHKSHWLLFLSILKFISGYDIYFNDKFGRLNIKFENETINLIIPNEICTHSAYIEVISKRNNWDYLQDRTRIHNIIINLNPENINPNKRNEIIEEEDEFDEENFNAICDEL